VLPNSFPFIIFSKIPSIQLITTINMLPNNIINILNNILSTDETLITNVDRI
jgi:hypothetical protein